jgi:flagellar basal body-associated protein FliL
VHVKSLLLTSAVFFTYHRSSLKARGRCQSLEGQLEGPTTRFHSGRESHNALEVRSSAELERQLEILTEERKNTVERGKTPMLHLRLRLRSEKDQLEQELQRKKRGTCRCEEDLNEDAEAEQRTA